MSLREYRYRFTGQPISSDFDRSKSLFFSLGDIFGGGEGSGGGGSSGEAESDSAPSSGASTGSQVGFFIKVGSAIADAFGPSKENADKSGALWTDYVNNPNTKLPYWPTKQEMNQAAADGNWESHFRNSINSYYDENSGTWNPGSSDDWRGAVAGLTPISVKVFKGHTEQAVLNSHVNAVANARKGSQAAASVSQVFKNASPITWIVTAVVGVLIVGGLIIYGIKQKAIKA